MDSQALTLSKPIEAKVIEDYLFTTGTKLNPQQKTLFIRLAQEFNLNPFKREIYAIPYGSDFNIVTGYQVYIQRAEATGKLDGWDVQSEDEKATINIYRKDFSKPFQWTVKRSDFDTGYKNWKKMPDFMLKKVAIGQGFRLAFPNELSGVPYLPEEIEEIENGGSRPSQKVQHDDKAEKGQNSTPQSNGQSQSDNPNQENLTIEQIQEKEEILAQLKEWYEQKLYTTSEINTSIKNRNNKVAIPLRELPFGKLLDLFHSYEKTCTERIEAKKKEACHEPVHD
jgi:hypothetical protein